MNLADSIFLYAQRYPDHEAIVHVTERVTKCLTYAELVDSVDQARLNLEAHSILNEEYVSMFFADPIADMVHFVALTSMGIGIYPTNYASEVERRVSEQLQINVHVSDFQSQHIPVASIVFQLQRRPLPSDLRIDCVDACVKPWLVRHSSGTTGDPKIFITSHHDGSSRQSRYWHAIGKTTGGFLSITPPHFGAARQRLFYSLNKGKRVFIPSEGMAVDTLISLIQKFEIETVYAVPLYLRQILEAHKSEALLFKHTPIIESTSSIITPAEATELRQRVTPNFINAYSVSEFGHISAESVPNKSNALIAHRDEPLEGGSLIGRPLGDVDLAILTKSGDRVGPGEVGLIAVKRNDQDFAVNYLKESRKWVSALQDGWFLPGDLGYRTPDGNIVYMGRADDLIIFNGINIYPGEIESAAKKCQGVTDVVAFGIPSDRHQSIPSVAIISSESFDEKRFWVEIRQKLGQRAPRHLTLVHEFPRNAAGKILRQKLIESALTTSLLNKSHHQRTATKDDNITLIHFMPFTSDLHLSNLEKWVRLLEQDDLFDCGVIVEDRPSSIEFDWFEGVLRLLVALLNSMRIPFFWPLEVVEFSAMGPTKQQCTGKLRNPHTSILPEAVFHEITASAFKMAHRLATANSNSLNEKRDFYAFIAEQIVAKHRKFMPIGFSTFEILKKAQSMNIDWIMLPNGYAQLGWGCHARRFDRSATDSDSAIARMLAGDKANTAKLLGMAGLPTPDHHEVTTLEDAIEASGKIGYPVVIKPVDGERGEGVSIDVTNDQIQDAFNRALQASYKKRVLVEKQAAGSCVRLFIANNRLLYAVRRLPIGVYADGKKSVEQLVTGEWEFQQTRPPWRRSKIKSLDELAIQTLNKLRLTAKSVPAAGEFVPLRPFESTAWGGVDENVTHSVHAANVAVAVQAAQQLGLDVAGVDLISPDVSQPWYKNGAIINEVNFAPLLGGGDISRSHIAEYLRRLIDNHGRIPIHVFVGGPAVWKDAMQHWRDLLANGVAAAISTDQETLDVDARSITLGLGSMPERLLALRLRQYVAEIVLVVNSLDEILTLRVNHLVESLYVNGVKKPIETIRSLR